MFLSRDAKFLEISFLHYDLRNGGSGHLHGQFKLPDVAAEEFDNEHDAEDRAQLNDSDHKIQNEALENQSAIR